jgi:hypothetical protein
VLVQDFPKVSELLEQYPSKSAPAGEVSTTPNAPLPTYLHRMSLRATTFSGKTIYMKRKTRVEGLQKVSTPRTFAPRVLSSRASLQADKWAVRSAHGKPARCAYSSTHG